MVGFIKALTAVIIAMMIQGGVSGAVETTPEEAVSDFVTGLMAGDEQIVERYVDNEYINFLANAEADDETKARISKALFKNLKYDIEDTALKGGAAVVEARISTNDFSDVMDEYKEVSYSYVKENLYDEDITDKDKLSAKCLDIYVDQIEKDAEEKASLEKKVYIPMIEDGYGGWKLLLSDDIVKTLMGQLSIPK